MQLEQNLRHFGVLYESHIFWNYTCLYFPYFYKTTHFYLIQTCTITHITIKNL